MFLPKNQELINNYTLLTINTNLIYSYCIDIPQWIKLIYSQIMIYLINILWYITCVSVQIPLQGTHDPLKLSLKN